MSGKKRDKHKIIGWAIIGAGLAWSGLVLWIAYGVLQLITKSQGG